MNNLIMTYRGTIQACAGHKNSLLFVTTHPEKQATALYRVDVTGTLHETASFRQLNYPLPCGGLDLLLTGTTAWIAGQDGKLYTQALDNDKHSPKPLRGINTAEHPVRKLIRLTDGHLALLQPQRLGVLHCNSGTIKHSLELSDTVTVAATDPSGHWLAVGFQNGAIAVYQFSDGELHFSAQTTIHQGRVSALAFEPHALRFFSAGADKKLFSTHAQGELQPLDKGKSSHPNGVINTLLMGEERFFSGASDKSIKAWAFSGGRPMAINKALPKVTALARIEVQGKGILIACGTDNSLRFMPLSSKEEPNEVITTVRDGYAWADNMLRERDSKRNEEALQLLAGYNDKKSFELLTRYLDKLDNKALREQIIAIAAQSSHPDTTHLLETALRDNKHDTVRQAAYHELVSRTRKGSIRPYTLALEAGFTDIGAQALEALSKLAKKQPQAEQAIINTLGHHKQRKLRLRALYLLEGVYAKTSPQASLHALKQNQPELQRAALIRLYQRQLLDHPEVQRALLNAQDSHDEWVRQTAFLIAILGQPLLADTLKQRDATLARQLTELEDFDLLNPEDSKPAPAKQSAKTSLTQKLKNTLRNQQAQELRDSQLKPLLQGMTSQHADICFSAAAALAVLQDQRAFGLLLLLSHENDPNIRVGVCRAFALLQQTDALQQLEMLLDDPSEAVRDAAFSAISLLEADVWQQVCYGFGSGHADLHHRALKTLLDALGKSKTGKLPEQGQTLLEQALNDPFESIRQETFKACLNRRLGGDMPGTLRLLRASRYENVHREVLNETLAAIKEDWAQVLLPELLDDDFEAIRQAAFTHALKEKKRFDRHAILERAVASRFADIRHSALNQLNTKPGGNDWSLVKILIQDEDFKLRLQALQTVVQADDLSTLEQALESRFEDIRIQAAIACAQFASAKAYDPLIALASTEKPQQKHAQAQWHGNLLNALRGLNALGDTRAFECVLSHVHNRKESAIAEEAAHTLPWVSDTTHLKPLTALLQDERDQVRSNAALALALLEDEAGCKALDDENTAALLIPPFRMAAVLTRQPVTVLRLRHWLEQANTAFSASLILFSHELLLYGARPTLSLSALAVDNPALQRRCADLLSRYQQPEQCWAYLQHDLSRQLNRGDQPDWQIPLTTLRQIAAILVHGSHHLRAHLLLILQAFDCNDTLENWLNTYQAFNRRYAEHIREAESKVNRQTPETHQQHHWQKTAFGAYLGLLRAEDRFKKSATLNLRLQAINGLRRLAEQGDKDQRQSVFSCLLTLLNHPDSELRDKAYADLQALGLPPDELGKAAIDSRHDDMAQRGLQLLASHLPRKQAHQLLESLLLTGSDALAHSAYDLLHADQETGLITLAPLALKSYSHAVRRRCMTELGQHYNTSEQVPALLVDACANEARDVAQQAVLTLARHQHPATLEQLQNLWHSSEDTGQQHTLLPGFHLWRGQGAAATLLACGDQQDTLQLAPQAIYNNLGMLRDTAVADTLLQRLQDKHPQRKLIAAALRQISGYDQPIPVAVDTDEPPADKRWQEKQFPRYDDLAIRLFSTLLQTDLPQPAKELLAGLAWMPPNPAADNALTEAAALSDTPLLERVVTTIALRARRRQGPVTTLLQLLSHKDPHIQFLAAEGLGRSGHSQGNSVLLAASDYLDDLAQRIRAIDALGQSGDPTVLDKLLELANNKEHALCEAATEAIGHLGQGEQGEDILQLLKTQLSTADPYSDMPERALSGLRWLNSLEGWQTIADFAENNNHDPAHRAHALSLLRHWDSPRSRDLLLKILRESDSWNLCQCAWHSARYLWQADDITVSPVDMALMQGKIAPSYIGDHNTLERVARYADTTQLMALFSNPIPWAEYNDAPLAPLRQTLLQKQDHNVADIAHGLGAARSTTVALMAQLAAVQKKPAKPLQQALQQALETRQLVWQQRWQEHARQPDARTAAARATEQHTMTRLLHAAVIQQTATSLLVDYLQSHAPDAVIFHKTLLNALLLVQDFADNTLKEAVISLQDAPAVTIRQLARQILYQQGIAQTEAGWESFLHQPGVLADTLFSPAIAQAARTERQSRALPVLMRQQNVQALHAIATDTSVDEVQRSGAIEGLGRIRSAAAEACLQALHQQSDIDPDLGRAAYRALRRSQRARHKTSPDQPSQGAAA